MLAVIHNLQEEEAYLIFQQEHGQESAQNWNFSELK